MHEFQATCVDKEGDQSPSPSEGPNGAHDSGNDGPFVGPKGAHDSQGACHFALGSKCVFVYRVKLNDICTH